VPDQHDGSPARHVAAGHGGATEVARDDGGRLGKRDELAVAELEAVRAPGDEVGVVEVRVLADTQVRGFQTGAPVDAVRTRWKVADVERVEGCEANFSDFVVVALVVF